MNAYRAARGLSQLTMSQSLTNAAAWKASELAVDVPATGGAAFSHSDYGDRPDAPRRGCRPAATATRSARTSRSARPRRRRSWTRGSTPQATARTSSTRPGRRSASAPPAGAGATAGCRTSASPTPIRSSRRWRASPPHRRRPRRPPRCRWRARWRRPPRRRSPRPPRPRAAPDVEIMARPRSRTRQRTARIRWVVSGQLQKLSCSLNGKALRRCGSTGRTLRVRRGRHVFRVTATGPMGTDTQAGPLARRARLAQTGSPSTRASAASRARSTRSCTSAFGSVNRPRT